MSKGRGRGTIAIALFDIAGALERLAGSDERRVLLLAQANDLHNEANEALKADAAERQAIMQLLADDVRASAAVKPGSASLLDQYRHAARQLVASMEKYHPPGHDPACTVCALKVVVDADS